ncbi:MAG TPA: hypothetical protein VNQ76_01880 [Planctomicrobium sp.]|nr:hypothetical protein [Planctomicrobium sp.]
MNTTALSELYSASEGIARQTLIVLAYFTGQRPGDLIDIEWSAIQADMVTVHQKKTGRLVDRPLHPVIVDHLNRLHRTGERIFSDTDRTIQRGLLDVRRFACSEIEKVSTGLGAALLGHADREVEIGILRDGINQMPFPVAWKGGEK